MRRYFRADPKGSEVAVKPGERVEHILFVRPVELAPAVFKVTDEATGKALERATVSTREIVGVTDRHGKLELKMPAHASNAPVAVSHPDYYPKVIAVSPKSREEHLAKLTPLPFLKGTIRLEPTEEGEVQLRQMSVLAVSAGGKRKKAVASPDGFQLRLLPRDYDLTLRAKCETGSYMTLHTTRVTVTKEGARCDVRTPRVGKVSITVRSNLPNKAPKPKALVLLDKAGKRVWATDLDQKTMSAVVYSPVGDYQLAVVAEGERAAKLVGPLTVTGLPYGERTVEVGQWHHLIFNAKTGKFAFGRPVIP